MATPLNASALLYGALTQTKLRVEAMEFADTTDYVDFLSSVYGDGSGAEKLLTYTGECIESIDPTGSQGPERPVVSAFQQGGLLALRTAEICGGAALLKIIERVPVLVPTLGMMTADKTVARQLIAELGMKIGQAEYDHAERTNPFIGKWEDEVVAVRNQLFFRCGFGFMSFYGRRALEMHDAREMENSSLSDEDLARLLQQ